MKQLDVALKFLPEGRSALDVGCGAGGRILSGEYYHDTVRKLEESGFE